MAIARDPGAARRATLGLAAVILLLIGVTGFAVHALSGVQDRLDEIALVNDREQRVAVQMREHVQQVGAGVRDIVLEDDVQRMRPLSDRVAAESLAYDSAEATLGALLAQSTDTAPAERALFAAVAADKANAWPLLSRVMALGADNDDAHATRLFMAEAKPALAHWMVDLTQLAVLEEQQNQDAVRAAHASYGRALATLGLLCAVTLLVGVLAAWSFIAPAPRPRA